MNGVSLTTQRMEKKTSVECGVLDEQGPILLSYGGCTWCDGRSGAVVAAFDVAVKNMHAAVAGTTAGDPVV